MKVTGIEAFKIQQGERGAALNANLPLQGGGNVTILSEPAAPAAAPDPASQQGNWVYQGQPGVSDAYAPPSAVVSSPGDVPKAGPAADTAATSTPHLEGPPVTSLARLEYLFDTDDSANNYFYNWAQLGYSPLDWLTTSTLFAFT